MKYRPYLVTSDQIKQVQMNGAGRTRRINQKYLHNLSRESWREQATWKTSMWTEGGLFRDLRLWWSC